ncbi:unnamed protein product [Lactuca saligna]|uniref:SWIM-type domain-containing protein n=1 Tax=Lactuca saligna TaxID=75948 RepID=A0AA35YRL5_LACSI|nr:unnamed protein product [Lactuca saligna]
MKNSCRKIYCFGSQKCIHIDTTLYKLSQLHEEVIKRYSSKNNPKFSILYVDKYAPDKSIIELDSDEKFMAMLSMYGSEKQVTIYVTIENNLGSNIHANHSCANRDEPHDEYDADFCPSEEIYHSHLSSDNEDGIVNDDDEVNSFSKNSIRMEVGSKFENVVDFRRALNHFAVINEFNYYIQKSDPTRFTARCENLEYEWRIHASITQDEVTFEVKKMVEVHTCTRSNKGGNKRATQGWIANVVTDKLKSDGDVSPYELRNWIMKTYNVDVPYLKVFRGKEQAYTDMYGKWEDSFMKMDEFREELLQRNEGSIVEIDFDKVGGKKLFKRNLVSTWNGVLVPIAKNHLNDIAKNLGEYEVTRSCENQAEVKYKGTRWEVSLEERKCSCRMWQVQGRPCVHSATFIAFIRDANWDKYVDPYFTIEKFKSAYAFQIAPMPGQDQWAEKNGEKIYPPIIKRPPGRPRKNRTKSSDEPKRRHKCPRCGEYGHRQKTCKNPASQSFDQSETATSKRGKTDVVCYDRKEAAIERKLQDGRRL